MAVLDRHSGFYTAFKKKSRTPPTEDLFVMEGKGLQGMKMRTNRNAWGMKFKAAVSGADCYSGYR